MLELWTLRKTPKVAAHVELIGRVRAKARGPARPPRLLVGRSMPWDDPRDPMKVGVRRVTGGRASYSEEMCGTHSGSGRNRSLSSAFGSLDSCDRRHFASADG